LCNFILSTNAKFTRLTICLHPRHHHHHVARAISKCIDILVHGRRSCGRCHCLDSGGPLSLCIPLSSTFDIISHAADFAPADADLRALCVCVLCEPPARLSVYPSSPPQPIAHNGVCHLVIANYLHTLYGLAQFEAQIARALSAERESEPVLMLAAIPMTMTLMRKCVCIALYTISRLIE
jgi:hypothetical protein